MNQSNNDIFGLCKLCKEREANQTGSHIFSHALVSKCTNVEGEKGRDKELMFTISQSGDTAMYIGRNANLDKVEEVKGRPLTEEEIAINNNGLVRDNVFCTQCEKLFGKIETAFAKPLNDIRKNNLIQVKTNIDLRLYFLIQVWRASAVGQDKWRLDPAFEEYLRNIIHTACSQHERGIERPIIDELLSIPMIVTFLETLAEESSNIVLITDNENPYLLFLCDFILQLYEPKQTIIGLDPPIVFNLNTAPGHKPINHQEAQFILGFMKDKERQELIIAVHGQAMVGPVLNGIIEKFKGYCLEYGIAANHNMICLFMTLLLKEEPIPLAERYSDERIKSLAKKLTGS